jgi:hypothetical protein
VDRHSDFTEVLQPSKSWLLFALSIASPHDACPEQLRHLRLGHVRFVSAVDEQENRALRGFAIAVASTQLVRGLPLKPRAKPLGLFPGQLLPEIVFHTRAPGGKVN